MKLKRKMYNKLLKHKSTLNGQKALLIEGGKAHWKIYNM